MSDQFMFSPETVQIIAYSAFGLTAAGCAYLFAYGRAPVEHVNEPSQTFGTFQTSGASQTSSPEEDFDFDEDECITDDSGPKVRFM